MARIQALIDERKEKEARVATLATERDALSLDTDEGKERDSAIRDDVLLLQDEMLTISDSLLKEHKYVETTKSKDRIDMHKEMDAGSEMHLDFATYIDKEVGGIENLYDALLRDKLTIPMSMLDDDLFSSDLEQQIKDFNTRQAELVSGDVNRGTSVPRNRAVSPLIPPYQMGAFTSFADVVPRLPTNDISIQYPKLVWRTADGAGVVAEGVAAATGNYTTVTAGQQVLEIVAMAEATKQALRDIPQLRQQLRGALRADARQKYDRMVVGTATNQEFDTQNRILGNSVVLNKTEVNADVILKEAGILTYKIIGESYFNPNVVCIFGGDWGDIVNATLDQDKDAYFDGRPLQLFARPVLLSSGIPTEMVISGAFNPATINMHIKQEAQLEIGQTGTDFESRNYHLLPHL